MKKTSVQSNINLETLAGGAFAEKLNEALMQVAENIQNPNTEATTKRQIQITLKFAPNKTRQLVSTQIAVTTKLAAGAEEQQPAPTGKPLDLKNRNKKPAEVPTDQEQEKAEAAAGELVPGRDFDPETGEVFENGRPPVDQPTTTEQPKSNQHKVITMGPKAVNA